MKKKINKEEQNLIEKNLKKNLKPQQLVESRTNRAIEQSRNMMNISNKLVPRIPKTVLINEQFNKI